MDTIKITATNGDRCFGEAHQFRIGREAPDAIEFRANHAHFHEQLEEALINHGIKHGESRYWNIQVRPNEETDANAWRQIQNPETGGVMAITAAISTSRKTTDQLYKWACNTIQMWRDIDALASGISNLAIDQEDENEN